MVKKKYLKFPFDNRSGLNFQMILPRITERNFRFCWSFDSKFRNCLPLSYQVMKFRNSIEYPGSLFIVNHQNHRNVKLIIPKSKRTLQTVYSDTLTGFRGFTAGYYEVVKNSNTIEAILVYLYYLTIFFFSFLSFIFFFAPVFLLFGLLPGLWTAA